MKLTEKQEQRVARYLREVRAELRSIPRQSQQEALESLRLRIQEELNQYGDDSIRDSELERALRNLGAPATRAAYIKNSIATPAPSTLAPETEARDERRWLGVCLALARMTGLQPWVIRGLAILAGVLTAPMGPLALIAYLGVYFYLRSAVGRFAGDRIDGPRLAWAVVRAVVIALCVYTGGRVTVWFIYWAPAQFLEDGRLLLDAKWTWLERRAGSYLFYALFWAIPLAVLSGLPAREAWQSTFRKLTDASLALYAVVLAFGVSGLVVGTLLALAELYTGLDLIEEIQSAIAGG